MRLLAGLALASVLLAALPAEAAGALPDSCPGAPVECAQAVPAMELGACLGCCVPCPPISDVVFLKNEAEASALTSLARAQDELAGWPASSPTPGHVAAPMAQFATVSVPAFVDEASWEVSDAAAQVLFGLPRCASPECPSTAALPQGCLDQCLQPALRFAEGLPDVAGREVAFAAAVVDSAASTRVLWCRDVLSCDPVPIVDRCVAGAFTMRCPAEAVAGALVTLQECIALEVVCGGYSLLQFTVLLQVVVGNAVYLRWHAEDAAAATLAAAQQPDPDVGTILAPGVRYVFVIVPGVADEKLAGMHSFVGYVLDA